MHTGPSSHRGISLPGKYTCRSYLYTRSDGYVAVTTDGIRAWVLLSAAYVAPGRTSFYLYCTGSPPAVHLDIFTVVLPVDLLVARYLFAFTVLHLLHLLQFLHLSFAVHSLFPIHLPQILRITHIFVFSYCFSLSVPYTLLCTSFCDSPLHGYVFCTALTSWILGFLGYTRFSHCSHGIGLRDVTAHVLRSSSYHCTRIGA